MLTFFFFFFSEVPAEPLLLNKISIEGVRLGLGLCTILQQISEELLKCETYWKRSVVFRDTGKAFYAPVEAGLCSQNRIGSRLNHGRDI